MANEELFKRLSEAAKKAAEGGGQPKPPEAPPPPEAPEVKLGEHNKQAGAKEVNKERVANLAAKLAEATSETTKRLVGSEVDFPTDERVFSVIESLITADESQLADPEYMRGIGQQLVALAKESGLTSPTAVEARRYLRKIVAEHPSLSDLQYEAVPIIAGGSGKPDEEANDEATVDKDPELTQEVGRLFNETADTDLKDTAIASDLQELQYRFRVDPGAAYDSRLTDDAVRRMVEKGRREGLDPKL